MKFKYLVCLPCIFFFFNCMSMSFFGAPPIDVKGVQSHAWTEIYEDQELRKDFALYSYVLIKNRNSMEKFGEKLIIEIIDSNRNIFHINDINNKFLYNVFVLPVQRNITSFSNDFLTERLKHEDLLRNSYDYNYSKKICNYLINQTNEEKIKKILKEDSGPFIISVLKPILINEQDYEANVLLLDCSNLNNAIIPLVVDRYFNYIENNDTEENKIMKNFSIYLANGIVNLNEYISSFNIVLDAINS